MSKGLVNYSSEDESNEYGKPKFKAADCDGWTSESGSIRARQDNEYDECSHSMMPNPRSRSRSSIHLANRNQNSTPYRLGVTNRIRSEANNLVCNDEDKTRKLNLSNDYKGSKINRDKRDKHFSDMDRKRGRKYDNDYFKEDYQLKKKRGSKHNDNKDNYRSHRYREDNNKDDQRNRRYDTTKSRYDDRKYVEKRSEHLQYDDKSNHHRKYTTSSQYNKSRVSHSRDEHESSRRDYKNYSRSCSRERKSNRRQSYNDTNEKIYQQCNVNKKRNQSPSIVQLLAKQHSKNLINLALPSPSVSAQSQLTSELVPSHTDDIIPRTNALNISNLSLNTNSAVKLPSYYNPNVVNPNKYAEQMQKRKLLWGSKKSDDSVTKWGQAQFSEDSDGKMASKFMRLMGIKTTTSNEVSGDDMSSNVKSREAMFSSMEQQYEVARQATHTMRGVGLGFGIQAKHL